MLQQPISSNTFIGRHAELEGLTQLLRAAETGHGSTVLVSGEAGVGKSRLVAEVSGLSKLVLRGHCFEPDGSLPFAPVIDLLRTSFSNLPADAVPALIGPDGADLARLLPELSAPDRRTPASVVPDSEQDKHRLFQALDDVLSRWARSGPLLLIVEDLHWSDDTSLEYLTHLARGIRALPVLMLLTYRPDEVQPGLQAFLAALNRERLASGIVLQPLAIDEVDALLRAIFNQPHSIRSDFLHEIQDLTEGNPFFIEEIIGSLIASGDIFRTAGRWDRKALRELSIPRSVQHAVVRRMEHLSPEAREVLRIAAVAGQRFSFSVVMEVAAVTEQAMIRIVRELVAAYLVLEESAERFRFRHALTRQAVYQDLLERERRWMHRTLGETIEGLYADRSTAPLADLSYHFHAAGAWAKALEYAPLAGKLAQDLHAPRAAAAHYTRALDAAQILSLPLAPDLFRERGLAYATLGEFDRARDDLNTTLELASAGGNRAAEWQALFDLGDLWLGYDYSRSGGLFERALTIARDSGDRSLTARTLLRLGNWQVNTERPAEAERSLTDALEIFEEIGDRHAIAETLDLLGITADIAGDLYGMRDFLERAIAMYREIGDLRGLSSALATYTSIAGLPVFNAAAIPASMTQIDVAGILSEALAIAREIDWRAGEAYAILATGVSCTHTGRFSEAAAALDEGMRIATEIEHNEWLTIAHYAHGELYLGVLEFDKARGHLERARSVARTSGSLHFYHLVTGSLASACIAGGDVGGAAEVLDEVDTALPTETVGHRRIWLARAELAAARGKPEEALTIIDRLLEVAPNVSDQGDIPHAAKLRGDALLAMGRMDDAEVALLAAASGAEQQRMLSLAWQVQRSLGRIYQECGRPEDARAAFNLARSRVEVMASSIEDATFKETFRERAFAMLPREQAETSSPLTPREEDVARLVADGLSNRSIAEALFVSERTVETHVSNTLSKLGFTSRTQIATWVVERGLNHSSTSC
jgi:DNA-binding CsgD family transcriptional regulator